jgi:hypothetical protein
MSCILSGKITSWGSNERVARLAPIEGTPDDNTLLTLVFISIVKTGPRPITKVHGGLECLQMKPEYYGKGNCKELTCKIDKVTTTTAGAHGFPSRICDFRAGEIKHQMLRRAAKFCFT